jgi:hypothetical protein
MKNYPLLEVRVSTPTLELRGATDELLDQLAEVVRAGKTHADPAPYDDPIAILHLAFKGLGAKEAGSDAFVDNQGSNAISRGLGYEPNGFEWATRQGEPALLNRWRLTRDNWKQRRRNDIRLHNVEACHALLPLS